jgi:O-antigen/teichoic acid export membrane protein
MRLIHREIHKLRNSVLGRNFGWMLVGQGATLVLQAGYFAVLGRLLGAAEYGVYVGAFALTAILASFTAMGSGTILLRYVGAERLRFPAYWGSVLVLTTGFSVIFLSGAKLAAPHLLNPASAGLVLLAGIGSCFCNEVTRNAAMVFQTFERMKVTALINLASNLARFCAAGGMLAELRHASAFQWAVASMVVSALTALASFIAVTVAYGWPRFSVSLAIKGIPEGFGYSFAGSASSVYNDIDKTMLSHYGMNQANGIYALAYRIIDVSTTPVAALKDAAAPRFFREGSSNPNALRVLAERLTQRAVILMIGVAVVLYTTAPLIPLALGPGFAESVQAVRWLCLIPLLRAIHQISGCAVMGLGKQRYRTAAQLSVAVFNFSLNLFWIPAYGWKGAAGSSLLSDGLLALLSFGLVLVFCRKPNKVLTYSH